MEEQVMPKTLYGKLKQIKVELRKVINTKSGYNIHSKFKYYQLEDFLPQVLELFGKYNIYNEYFIDTDLEIVEEQINIVDEADIKQNKTVIKRPVEYAYLYLKNLDNEDDEMIYRLKTAEASVYGASAIQNLGAKITYMKRYIYMSLLDIVEPDAVDSAPQSDTQSVPQNGPQNGPQVAPQPPVNYTTNVAEMHKAPEPTRHTSGDWVVQDPVTTNNVTIEPTTGATTVEEPMTLETKTLIAQMLISKGKNPADGIQSIAQQLGTPVEQFKENQKQTIIDMIEKM